MDEQTRKAAELFANLTPEQKNPQQKKQNMEL